MQPEPGRFARQPGGDGNTVVLDSYQVCREKNVTMDYSEGSSCEAPREVADFVHSVGDVYGQEKIRFTFTTLPYSNNFPKISYLTFRTGQKTGIYRNLKCVDVEDQSIPDRFLVVECWVEKKEGDSEWDTYYFDSMEIVNGGEGCDPKFSRTVFRAQFIHYMCKESDFSYDSYSGGGIYLNRERVPTLHPRTDTPPSP